MASVRSNDIEIEYDVIGTGEPMLLIMGLGTQRIFWTDEFIEYFVDAGFQVIRFDNRDIGGSTHLDTIPPPTRRQLVAAALSRRTGRAPYLMADMANDAVGLLDQLGIERAHVVGASMGGMIAQSVAIGHPQRVATLTSIMSNTGDRRHGRVATRLLPQIARLADRTPDNMIDKSFAMWRLISGPHFEEGPMLELIEMAAKCSDDREGTGRQTIAIVASPDRTPALRRLRVPTLVMHGLRDPLVLPSGGTATARAIPESRLLMFPDMGHDLPRPRWGEITDAIVTNARRAPV